MDFILMLPDERYTNEITAYRQEFLASGSQSIQGSNGLARYDDPHAWIAQCRLRQSRETLTDPESATGDQYLFMRTEDNRLCGLINFRHELVGPELPLFGGHIGYSVRPSERRKGYATRMLAMVLDKCRAYGLQKVLVTCETHNEASRRTIFTNGGVYESTLRGDISGALVERYWITI